MTLTTIASYIQQRQLPVNEFLSDPARRSSITFCTHSNDDGAYEYLELMLRKDAIQLLAITFQFDKGSVELATQSRSGTITRSPVEQMPSRDKHGM